MLGKSVGDHVTVGAVEDVSVPRSNAQVLRRILLLRLRDVSASILSVVDTPRGLPLGLLGELGNRLNGIADRQEVNKANCLLTHDLDSVNRTEFAEVLAQLLLGHILRQVAQVHIAGSA